MITAARYLELHAAVAEGFAHEIEWSETRQPVSDPLPFWSEYGWVVMNSGMKNQIARKIWEKVRPQVLAGGSAHDVFGHKGKASAIDQVYRDREQLLQEYLQVPDSEKIAWLRTLPWIGKITCWHLAKNYGFDCAKPDRHLVRIAGAEGVHEMCARLARETGYRIATVDYVLWRAANLGMI
ncbi:hypothetical protein FY034_18850 (plasmid) [Trichlorobacter lovleyi]|uniref:hypothetical protein n=1 Tax=Trichlorobacter lovleyi TaxID=313985 RepID=UPI002240CFFD|nr:hypothetical protein [Trichlorobacter lovleyi]QOX81037.1 hypothetical protein FY034_18850 [Trichlorobacter lovleyi]